MTISTQARSAGPFTCNGATTVFPFTYKVFAASDVVVVLRITATGDEVKLVLGVDYNVALNADQNTSPGGTVTTLTAFPAGQTITLTSAVPYLQPTDLANQGGFYPSVINAALDRLTIFAQQVLGIANRALKFPISDGNLDATVPGKDQRKGRVLAFHETTGLPVAGPSIADTGSVAGSVAAIETVASNIADVNTVADNVTEVVDFNARYQGPKTNDPTTRNNGDALQEGDLYFNTATDRLRVFTGVRWSEANTGSVSVQRFTGNGSTVSFQLNVSPDNENVVQVFIGGVYQSKTEYDLTGANADVLTFTAAPPNGAAIEAVTFSILPLGVVDANQVQMPGGGTLADLAPVDPVTLGKALEVSQFSGLTPSKPSSLLKISDQRFRYFLHLGGRTWQVGDLVNNGLDSQGNVTPFGWAKTDINDFVEPYVWGDAAITSSGSSGELTSTDSVPYIGHRALQLLAVGAYIELSLQVNQSGANVYLNFSGRTTGNIVNVTIDGSTALVNEATTVDTYTAVDLTHRQSVLVASNLPAKSTPYLIRFTVSASKNPSSGAGDRFIFNAVTLDGGEFGNPWSARVRPKPWTTSTVVAQWEERIGQFGRVYVATTGGTTGTTAPSHASGSASDGTVTWAYVASSSFVNRTQTATLQAEGSQLEYAYEFRKTGDTNYQDVGGNLHGNEYLTGLRIYVDSAARNVGIGQYLVGNNIQLVQDIYAYYGTLPTVEHLASTTLTHSIGGGRVVVSHQSDFKLSGNFGYHYPAMWPIVYYSATDARTTFDEMELKQFGRIDPDSYAGQVNPFVGGTTDLQMRAIGSVYKPIGTQGSPTSTGGEYHIIATLQATDYGVNDYEFGTRLASMAPNIAGSAAPNGGASWAMKMYFGRSNTGKTEPVTVGKVVRSDAEYKVSLFRK